MRLEKKTDTDIIKQTHTHTHKQKQTNIHMQRERKSYFSDRNFYAVKNLATVLSN